MSGLSGSLLSALWYAHRTLSHVLIVNGDVIRKEQLDLVVSVGASGALMGIAGARLAHWLVMERGSAPPEAQRMRNALLQTIGLTLLMGLLLPDVDNPQPLRLAPSDRPRQASASGSSLRQLQ